MVAATETFSQWLDQAQLSEHRLLAHHRLDGRPYGKLLPRYAGPIAQFVLTHPQASRYDILDFIDQTFGIRVSRVALYHFLKKFGLDQVPGTTTAPTAAAAQSAST